METMQNTIFKIHQPDGTKLFIWGKDAAHAMRRRRGNKTLVSIESFILSFFYDL